MAKPQAVRIPSDDCTVTVGGVEYRPHEGEWVEIRPVATIAEIRAMEHIRRMRVEIDAAQGEPDEGIRMLGIMDKHFGAACEALARRILAWNWTDDNGEPLPEPASHPKALEQLRADEILWLVGAAQGETPTERGNA